MLLERRSRRLCAKERVVRSGGNACWAKKQASHSLVMQHATSINVRTLLGHAKSSSNKLTPCSRSVTSERKCRCRSLRPPAGAQLHISNVRKREGNAATGQCQASNRSTSNMHDKDSVDVKDSDVRWGGQDEGICDKYRSAEHT